MSNQISAYDAMQKSQSASYPNAFQAQQMMNSNVAKVEERPIDAAFSKLTEEISAISHALANLEIKINPYLQPEPPEKDSAVAAPYPITSMTVNKILTAANDIRAAVRFINKLEARLD
jgi:hypothetical protein